MVYGSVLSPGWTQTVSQSRVWVGLVRADDSRPCVVTINQNLRYYFNYNFYNNPTQIRTNRLGEAIKTAGDTSKRVLEMVNCFEIWPGSGHVPSHFSTHRWNT